MLLQQARLQDLIELGWLSPGAQLISSEYSGEATATVTADGGLDVAGIGTFQSPETTAKGALGLDSPQRAWYEWHVENAGDAAPRADADTQRLGEQPALNDLRRAARGE